MGQVSKTALCSELRNAELLVERFGDRIRYAPGLGWLAWDSRRWAQDEGAIIELCKETLRDLYEPVHAEFCAALELLSEAEAKEESKTRDRDVKAARELVNRTKAYPAWLALSMSKPGIKNMMTLATTSGKIRINASELDANPHQFNCQNGTVDLRTGTLYEHSMGDLITRISPIVFNPLADQALWLSFLASATLNDADMIEELRLLSGYTLLGGPNVENVIAFISGPPGSGKGTFVDSIKAAMGKEYVRVVPFSIFLKTKSQQELRPDMLVGRRMVVAAEANEEDKIDEGKISSMSGGDTLNLRALYQASIDYEPIFTPWLQANNPPKMNLDGVSNGMARRLITPHFQHAIPEAQKNKEVKKYHTDPLRGGAAVLAWMVSGAVAYLAAGKLPVSVASRARKEKLRADNDPIARFVSQYLRLAPQEVRENARARYPHLPEREGFRAECKETGDWIPKKTVREKYDLWCKEEGNKSPMSTQKLAAAFELPAYGCHFFYHGKYKGEALFGARELRLSDELETPQQEDHAPASVVR